ncbi:protein Atg16l2 isoform X3 [Moschus berezovskii]|uniref:protein Atg16l2 isoform X3 n=1 Tax=Moschus berezovskii TaxID=68408 RepID=UPI002444FD5B|nr:protein Atg16l2 isoform X3 [Moschus berezovskii]
MEGSGDPGDPGDPAARWKRHIVRQLRQRDRTQKALFLELVPAYNRLLEKAELLARFSEKLQPEPNDVTPSVHQGPWEKESDQGLSPAALRVKWQEEAEALRLVCGEMAYQVVEKNKTLSTLKSQLEERQSRLAALQARVEQLEEARAKEAGQVHARRALNEEQRAAYEALRARVGHQEAALRGLEEEACDLLERLVQQKARAAAERNLRNERRERAKQARVSQELKKAAKRTVSISESPDTLGDGIREEAETLVLAPRPGSLESEAGEKWKRPFRGHHVLRQFLPIMVKLGDFIPNPCPPPPSWDCSGSLCSPGIGGVSLCHIPDGVPLCGCSEGASGFQEEKRPLNRGSPRAAIPEHPRVCDCPTSHPSSGCAGRLKANQTLEGAGGSITSVDFDPSGSQLLAATYNKAAQLWKVGEAQSKETLSGHTDKVTAAKFKLTRHQAVTGSRDRTVKEWDLCRAYCSRTINVLSYCNDVVCGDHVIISGHNDQKIRFWDSRGPHCTQVIPVQGRVTSLSLSHDQLHLLSCSRDDTLKVIDLRVSNIRQVFRADGFKCGSDWTKAVFSAAINAVAWCYSGSHVVSVDQAKKVVLWH